MVFLLATPVAFTLQGDARDTASRAVAVVVGVLAATVFFHATHEGAPRRVARLGRGVVRDLRRIAASADAEEARRRRGVLADRVVRMAMAAETDERLARPAETAVDLLGLGAALTRLVSLREVGAPAGAGGRPVAAVLERLRDDLFDPFTCAEELERTARSLADSATATSPAAAAARHLRDAARIVRREHALLGR
jgi:fusaric acid resistance family protein